MAFSFISSLFPSQKRIKSYFFFLLLYTEKFHSVVKCSKLFIQCDDINISSYICAKETTQYEFIQLHRINKQPYKFHFWTSAPYDRKKGRTKIHLFPHFQIDKERILSALLNCHSLHLPCQKKKYLIKGN